MKENGSRNLTIKIPSIAYNESENKKYDEHDKTLDILNYIANFIGSAKIIIGNDAK